MSNITIDKLERSRYTVQVSSPVGRYPVDHSKNLWWGTVLCVIAEASLFLGLLYAFYYFRISGQEWPPQGTTFDLLVPIITVGLLVASSVTIRLAGVAARLGRLLLLKIAVIVTMILGMLFVDGQVYQFLSLNISIDSTPFTSVFYMIIGFHAVHVVGGVLLLSVVTLHAVFGTITPERRIAVQCAELYWHFVVVSWIVLFAVLYLF